MPFSYLNTLRQRKQTREETLTPNGGKSSKVRTGPPVGSKYEVKKDDPEEYEKFLELHKKLGIPRMTQYNWLSQVVFIAPEIRKSSDFKSLTATDRRKITASEISK